MIYSENLATNCVSTGMNESFLETATFDHLRKQAVDSGKVDTRECESENVGSRVLHQRRRCDTNSVKSENQDKKGFPEYQKQLILLNLKGVEASTNAQNAQVEWSLLYAGGCMNLILDALCFWCVSPDAHCSQFLYSLILECTHKVFSLSPCA